MPFHLLPDSPISPIPPASPNAMGRLSRRDFLAGVALGVAGLAVGCSQRAGSRGNSGGWDAWMADTHLAADPAAMLHGQTMAVNLRAVVDDILDATDPPRALFLNGDIALTDGQPADYQAFLAATKPLRAAKIPVHLALGNHDDRETFREVLGASTGAMVDKHVGVVEGTTHRTLVLDSLHKVNSTAGVLGEAQVAWLARELDARPETPAIIMVHHNPNAHSASALTDTDALMEILRPRRQAKAVIYGHTHAWHAGVVDGLHMVNLPAVGYKFLRKQPLGWCAFRPEADGGELELRCVGGDRKQDRRRIEMRWRSA